MPEIKHVEYENKKSVNEIKLSVEKLSLKIVNSVTERTNYP